MIDLIHWIDINSETTTYIFLIANNILDDNSSIYNLEFFLNLRIFYTFSCLLYKLQNIRITEYYFGCVPLFTARIEKLWFTYVLLNS